MGDGTLAEGIPNSQALLLKTDPAIKLLSILDASDSYQLVLQGTGDGGTGLTVFHPLANGSVIKITYTDIPTTANSQATLALSGDTTEYPLSLDIDGDQTIDQEISPDAVELIVSPIANAGADQTVECTSTSGATVTLDGSASSDPNGDTLTFTWTGPFGTATGPDPTIRLPLGTHTTTLTVDDGKGGTASDTVNITVVDATPPIINSVTATPNLLWPPNHKMVPVTVAASATDTCNAAAPICRITSVSSNEPINGTGDGDTAPDWEITGNLALKLRAERAGTGTGRIYTITVGCTDPSGNSSTKNTTVTVPRNLGKTK